MIHSTTPTGIYTIIYDDSGHGNIIGSQPSDGPGSLNSFIGQQGHWPVDFDRGGRSLTHIGTVTGFNLLIEPHQDLTKGVYVTLGPMGWFYDYIDVPSGTAS